MGRGNIFRLRIRRWCHTFCGRLRGGTLVVHSDGNQTRDYVYVDDVVSAMVAASTAPNVDGLVINVGSGIETSVRDLVKQVLDVAGGKPEVIYNSKTSGGVHA